MPQAPDDGSTVLANQKFDEFLAEQIILNSHLHPTELTQNVLSRVRAYMQSVNKDFLLPNDAHLEHIVRVVWTKQLQHLCSKQLHAFIAENMSPPARNIAPMNARDACKNALERLANWCRSQGYPVEGIGVANEEEFEKLVSSVDKMAERFRTEQEKGAVALGQGVYADVVDTDDFNERMKRAGLS